MEFLIGIVVLTIVLVGLAYAQRTYPTRVAYVKQLLKGDDHHWSYRQLKWALQEIYRPHWQGRIPWYVTNAFKTLRFDIEEDPPLAWVYLRNPTDNSSVMTSLRRFIHLGSSYLSRNDEPAEWFLELWFPTYILVLHGGSLFHIRNGQLRISYWKGVNQIIDGRWAWSGDIAFLSQCVGSAPDSVSEDVDQGVDHIPLCWWLAEVGVEAEDVQELHGLIYQEALNRGIEVVDPGDVHNRAATPLGEAL